MGGHALQSQNVSSSDEMNVRTLYLNTIHGWNTRDAHMFAASFAEDGEAIGFDGSEMKGRTEIASSLQQIFTDHITAPYISKIRSIRLISPSVAILRAIVGMTPPGQRDINPALNAHQTLLAVKRNSTWYIELMQTTPAQFHGRPELVQHMTEELQQEHT